MCGYPISSFLFWRIREENKKDWISYEFIRDFNAEAPHNSETNLDGVNQDIFLVLDGQQRITSLNIGLRGSYRYFFRRWRKTRLYGAIDKPCGESVRRLTQKHVAKRYMIAEKLLSLHHESYQQYKYV